MKTECRDVSFVWDTQFKDYSNNATRWDETQGTFCNYRKYHIIQKGI